MTATSLSVDSLTTRFTTLQTELDHSADRIEQLTRLLKLEQAYTAKVKEEVGKRVQQVEGAVNQCRDELVHDRDEQRRQREERDEMEQRERAERQQRDVQVQAIVADIEERLTALQRQADEDRRQREHERRERDDSRQQTDVRLSTATQRTDETATRMESLVRMMAVMEERNRADDERRRQYEQQWQLDMTAAKEQQRTQLLKCVGDLRAFQLSIRDEMSRRERQVEAVKKAVLVMSEEMDRGAGGSGGGVAGEEVRRWREAERREREERERRRQREEMDKMRDDIYRYIDARISSLPPPRPAPPLPHTATMNGHERNQRAERLRGADDVRWVGRSMERLIDELTTERGRDRPKRATGVLAERAVHEYGARDRSTATMSAQGGYRASGAAISGAAAPSSVRQRAAVQGEQRHARSRTGR